MTGIIYMKMDHIFYNHSLEKYREIVERHTNLKINKPTRQFDYVFARSCYYYLCRTFGEMSFAKISKSVKKNHATVMHGLKELPYIIRHDPIKNKLYTRIVNEAKKIHIENKTGKSIERLVNDHNFYLLENDNLKNKLQFIERKYKKLLDENQEMKRVIYMMCDTD